MPATIAEARDQTLTLLKTAVDAEIALPNAAFSGFVLIWDDVEKQPVAPDPPASWARVKMLHTTGRKSALTDPNRRQRFTRGGILVIQLFTPGGEGLVSHDEIVSIILGAYEGKTTSGGLEFRNCRFQEVGTDGVWHQTNVFADFRYDEIK